MTREKWIEVGECEHSWILRIQQHKGINLVETELNGRSKFYEEETT